MIRSKLSHGQLAGFVSLPICTLVGGVIGLGLAYMLVRQFVIAALLLVAVSLCCLALNGALWKAQVNRYGPDPSEYVLYYPPLICSALALVLAVIAATKLCHKVH
ncbi:MAG: hypothetical protein U0930_15585 [Pirellulales bacterium]